MTVLSLTIDRSSLSLSDLVIPDTGSTGLVVSEWNEGGWEAENQIAESRWTDGGILTSSRRKMVSMDGVIRVYGSTLVELTTNYDALMNALNQFSYEITCTFATGTRTYTCMPANTKPLWTPAEMRSKTATVACIVPRQP